MTASPAFAKLLVLGADRRSGLTAGDSSAFAIATNTTGAKTIRLAVRLILDAWSAGTATYTITWTENGVPLTLTASVSAKNTPAFNETIAWPDDSTNITGQLTVSSIPAFNGTVQVDCPVEGYFQGELYVIDDKDGFTQNAVNDAVSHGYAGIFLDPSITYNVGTTITIGGGSHLPFILRSTMYGGSAYGDVDTPPAHYIKYTGTTGDGILIPDDAAKVRLEGIAIIADSGTSAGTTGASVRIKGARQSGLDNCYVKNKQTDSGYAVLIDVTPTTGHNAEDNDSSSCFFKGWRALGIGVNDGTAMGDQHSNDCVWYSITTSGIESGVYHVAGGNHTFINWYDRSNPSAACFNQSGGHALLIGGEDRTTILGANAILLSGGQLWVQRRAITGAGATTDVKVTGGDLYLNGIRSNTYTLLQTSGTVTIGRDCYSATATFTCNGGTIYYPTTSAHGATPTGSGTKTAY